MDHLKNWKYANVGDLVWISDEKEAYRKGKIISISGHQYDQLVIEYLENDENNTPQTATKEQQIFVDCSLYQSNDDELLLSLLMNKNKKKNSSNNKGINDNGKSEVKCVLPRCLSSSSSSNNNNNNNNDNMMMTYNNMDDLYPLNNATILNNVEQRFHKDQIYTRTGPMLIAVNPCRWLPIYGDNQVDFYHNHNHKQQCYDDTSTIDDTIDDDDNKNKNKNKNDHNMSSIPPPPHIFQEAEQTFQSMISCTKSQSIVICGESGSGKTESTKLILKYLCDITTNNNNNNNDNRLILTLGEKMVKSNPLMESFGNAKTMRNHNSSRFGKFTMVNFTNTNNGNKKNKNHHHQNDPSPERKVEIEIESGHVSNFLLEKSRVVATPLGERNYHIFYQLCQGANKEMKEAFYLPTTTTTTNNNMNNNMMMDGFHYLNQSQCYEVECMNDGKDFQETCQSMTMIGISEEEQFNVFRIVAAILHLGNVDFMEIPSKSKFKSKSSANHNNNNNDNDDDDDCCDVIDKERLKIVANLLQLNIHDLKNAFTTRVMVDRITGMEISSPKSPQSARNSRDALAKAIYDCLFDWLVVRVNLIFQNNSINNNHSNNNNNKLLFIGILDIFGFEDMMTNGFEQLFINYTNEKLQAIFNEITFRKEEDEYIKEKIEWDRTTFPDNSSVIELIEKRPMGLLPYMDAECSREVQDDHGSGSTDTMETAMLSQWNKEYGNGKHTRYAACGPATTWRLKDGNRTEKNHFVILHYAGPVIYTCDKFITKNRDPLKENLKKVIMASENPMLCEIFATKTKLNNNNNNNNNNNRSLMTTQQRNNEMTVANKFCSQLKFLCQTITSCQTRFIRCIKNNDQLIPQYFDRKSVMDQLINQGVVAALETRRAGYPTKFTYKTFATNFRVFANGLGLSSSADNNNNNNNNTIIANHAELVIQSNKRNSNQIAEAQFDNNNNNNNNNLNHKVLVARMMTHPVLLSTVTERQYRLGLTKIFMQADVLVVLESLKQRMLTPYAIKIQKWFVKQNHNILNRKLNKIGDILKEIETKAKMEGISEEVRVKDFLKSVQDAFKCAKTQCNNNPKDVTACRLIINDTYKKVIDLRTMVNNFIDTKESEKQQRAELLKKLDDCRKRLQHVNNQFSNIITTTISIINIDDFKMKLKSNEECIEAASTQLMRDNFLNIEDPSEMSNFLEERSQKILEVENGLHDCESMFDDLLKEQLRINELRESATNRLDTCKLQFIDLLNQTTTLEVINDNSPRVVVMKKQVEDKLSNVETFLKNNNDCDKFDSSVDSCFDEISNFQNTIQQEKAIMGFRNTAFTKLDSENLRFQDLIKDALDSKINDSPTIKINIDKIQSDLKETKVLLNETADPDQFDCIIHSKATDKIDEFEKLLFTEKRKKENNDRRQIAKNLIANTIVRLEDLQRDASMNSVHDKTNFMNAMNDIKTFISSIAALESDDDDVTTFLNEAQTLSDKVDNISSILDREKALKEENNCLRLQQLARLEPISNIMKSVKAQVASTPEIKTSAIAESIGKSSNELQSIKHLITTTDEPITTFIYLVDNVISLVRETEELVNSTKYIYTIREMEIEKARNDIKEMKKRIEMATNKARNSGNIVSNLSNAPIKEATFAIEIIQSTDQNKNDSFIQTAREKVMEAERAVEENTILVSDQEQDRDSLITQLDASKQRFSEYVLSKVGNSTALKDNCKVKDIVSSIEFSFKQAQTRFNNNPINASYIKSNELKHDKDLIRQLVEDLARVEKVIVEEEQNFFRTSQELDTNQSNFSLAEKRLTELKEVMEKSRLENDPEINDCVEKCETEFKLISSKMDTKRSNEIGDDVRKLLNAIYTTEQLIATTRACKINMTRKRAEIQDELDTVIIRFQSLNALVNAEGKPIQMRSEDLIRDLSDSVNIATKLLRRGGDIDEFRNAVETVKLKFEDSEREINCIIMKMQKMQKLSSNAHKKITSLTETLMMAHGKSENYGIKHINDVHETLNAAEKALDNARRIVGKDAVDCWIESEEIFSSAVNDAHEKVNTAEEIIDNYSNRKQRDDLQISKCETEFEFLKKRHFNVKQVVNKEELQMMHDHEVMTMAMNATENEMRIIKEYLAVGTIPSMNLLLERVEYEEEMLESERNKTQLRKVDYMKLCGELPFIKVKLNEIDTIVQASGYPLTLIMGEKMSSAYDIVNELDKIVKQKILSASIPLKISDAKEQMKQLEISLIQNLAEVEKVTEKMHTCVKKLDEFQCEFSEVQSKVGKLCSYSDALRVQMEADWGKPSWWGSQVHHSTLDGTPVGRDDIKQISSIQAIAEAVLNAEAAVLDAKRKVEQDIEVWMQNDNDFTSQIDRIMESTLHKVRIAHQIVDEQILKFKQEKKRREELMIELNKLNERILKVKTLSELRNKLKEKPCIKHAIEVAENAISVVSKVLEEGLLPSSSLSFKIAEEKCVYLEGILYQETQKLDREESQRDCFSGKLKHLYEKLNSIKEAQQQMLEDFKISQSQSQSQSQYDGNNENDKTYNDDIRRAEHTLLTVEAVLKNNFSLAIVAKEITTAEQMIEKAMKSLQSSKIRYEHISKMKEIEEERIRYKNQQLEQENEMKRLRELQKRKQLEDSIESLHHRLLVHKIQMESYKKEVVETERAVCDAKQKLDRGSLIASEFGISMAVNRVLGLDEKVIDNNNNIFAFNNNIKKTSENQNQNQNQEQKQEQEQEQEQEEEQEQKQGEYYYNNDILNNSNRQQQQQQVQVQVQQEASSRSLPWWFSVGKPLINRNNDNNYSNYYSNIRNNNNNNLTQNIQQQNENEVNNFMIPNNNNNDNDKANEIKDKILLLQRKLIDGSYTQENNHHHQDNILDQLDILYNCLNNASSSSLNNCISNQEKEETEVTAVFQPNFITRTTSLDIYNNTNKDNINNINVRRPNSLRLSLNNNENQHEHENNNFIIIPNNNNDEEEENKI